jgi:DNA-binding NarL/FixJ family response regulator
VIRVFVVDDHPVLRAGLVALLRSEPGFACRGAAGDLDEALAMIPESGADAVLLDRRLGDRDGLELAAALLQTPVVLYTAEPDPGLLLEPGVDALVDKSADPDELFNALRLAVRSTPAA